MSTEPNGPARPSSVRLVNLTPHEIVLQVSEVPESAASDDGADPGAIRLAPEGRFARVDDGDGQLGTAWLNIGSGFVSLKRLRRTNRTADLPAPETGTRFVVSRLTALAARNRHDLVFPADEIRDKAGRITGARGLGAFRPSWSIPQSYRDWRVSAAARRRQDPLKREWLTGVTFAAGTAVASGALALLPPALDNWAKNGWAAGQGWESWTGVACLVVGIALISWGALRWRRRNQLLRRMGTAYVIEEMAAPWQHEERESWLTAVQKHYAGMMRVPGPGELGDNWRWELGPDEADRWDDQLNQLVRSFWAVHYNDSQVTRNALFTWAPWAVAMAFGARATARRRGLVLHVRQRPSHGAAGPSVPEIDQEPHDFLQIESAEPLGRTAPHHTVTCTTGLSVRLTISALADHGDGESDVPERHRAGHPARRDMQRRDLVLLLVRTSGENIGPLPAGLSTVPPVTLGVAAALTGSVLAPGTYSVPISEWRLDSPVDPIPHLPWDAFPAAAAAISEWIVQQASGRIVLLATRMPQELGVGLGIQLGQRQSDWPEHVYPVIWQRGQLLVPNLELGARAVPRERS